MPAAHRAKLQAGAQPDSCTRAEAAAQATVPLASGGWSSEQVAETPAVRARKSGIRKHPKFVAVVAPQRAPGPALLFTGTSGWAYPTWKPAFYPAGVPPRAFLHEYAARLSSVEVNYTFRTLPTAAQLQGWLDATPSGFRFSFKAPQRITHFDRLRVGPETDSSRLPGRKKRPGAAGKTQPNPEALRSFVAALEPARAAGKLGPLLFQLPPSFAVDPSRLAAFLASPILSDPELCIAFEFRHPSWFTDETYALLRVHNAALCVAESDDLATPDVATASFRCYRLRRNGGYTVEELRGFAQRFSDLAQHGPVYVYFKHEDEPTGALNALAMLQDAVRLQRIAAGLASAGAPA